MGAPFHCTENSKFKESNSFPHPGKPCSSEEFRPTDLNGSRTAIATKASPNSRTTGELTSSESPCTSTSRGITPSLITGGQKLTNTSIGSGNSECTPWLTGTSSHPATRTTRATMALLISGSTWAQNMGLRHMSCTRSAMNPTWSEI